MWRGNSHIHAYTQQTNHLLTNTTTTTTRTTSNNKQQQAATTTTTTSTTTTTTTNIFILCTTIMTITILPTLQDDDGYAVKLKLRHYFRYIRRQTDDSPLYLFDSSFGEHDVKKSLLRDYVVSWVFLSLLLFVCCCCCCCCWFVVILLFEISHPMR